MKTREEREGGGDLRKEAGRGESDKRETRDERREEDQGSGRRKKKTGTRRRKGEYQEKVGSRNSREERHGRRPEKGRIDEN